MNTVYHRVIYCIHFAVISKTGPKAAWGITMADLALCPSSPVQATLFLVRNFTYSPFYGPNAVQTVNIFITLVSPPWSSLWCLRVQITAHLSLPPHSQRACSATLWSHTSFSSSLLPHTLFCLPPGLSKLFQGRLGGSISLISAFQRLKQDCELKASLGYIMSSSSLYWNRVSKN